MVASPVQRLRSMSRLMPVNVSRMRRPAQMPLGQLRPAPFPHQLLSPSLAVTLPLVAIVLVKEASLREDSLCARDLRLMMPLPQSRPPNLSHLPRQPIFMTISWIRTPSHLHHLSSHPKTTASQIGRGTIREDLHYHVRRVRTGAPPVLAHSSDASHGAPSRQAYTTRMRRAM